MTTRLLYKNKTQLPVRPFDAIEEAPEPPRATGQYPDPVWANADYSAAAQELLNGDNPDDVPDAPRATGQYPDPVWANGDSSAAAQSMTVASATTPDASNAFVAFKALNYAHEIGAMPDPEQPDPVGEVEVLLDYQEMYNIIRIVATADSGDTPYTALSADREFTTLGQPAYQQRHFGLALGLVLFTQESGLLGTLLTIMQRRDPVLFANIFGAQAQALLATTNAPTAAQRLQPVDGELLWSPAWTARFQRAGAEPVFQAAQNETAIEYQFRPMLNIAFGLGFTSDRGLAMVFDRVVTEGLGTGLRQVVQAAGALRTAAQRAHALHILGYTDLVAFQATTGWTPQDGNFGPETHAALVGALRQQGGATLPSARELMARLMTAATGPARQRLLRLQDATNFDDIGYRLH